MSFQECHRLPFTAGVCSTCTLLTQVHVLGMCRVRASFALQVPSVMAIEESVLKSNRKVLEPGPCYQHRSISQWMIEVSG